MLIPWPCLLAKINKNTPDPEGGHIERDAFFWGINWKTTWNRATSAIENLMSQMNSQEYDYQAGVKIISEMMSKTGITSVTDAGTNARSLQSYQDAHDGGRIEDQDLLYDAGQGSR